MHPRRGISIKKCVYLEHGLVAEITRSAAARGGPGAGATFSKELSRLARLGLEMETAQSGAELLAPALRELLESRLATLEAWLRPLVAKSGIYAATTTLLTLELLTGHRVAREEAKPFFELIRGRGYRLFRKGDESEVGADEPAADHANAGGSAATGHAGTGSR